VIIVISIITFSCSHRSFSIARQRRPSAMLKAIVLEPTKHLNLTSKKEELADAPCAETLLLSYSWLTRLARRRVAIFQMVPDEPKSGVWEPWRRRLPYRWASGGREWWQTKPAVRQGRDTVKRLTGTVKLWSCSSRDFDPKIMEFDHWFAILDLKRFQPGSRHLDKSSRSVLIFLQQSCMIRKTWCTL
jgi:hypothetical protein